MLKNWKVDNIPIGNADAKPLAVNNSQIPRHVTFTVDSIPVWIYYKDTNQELNPKAGDVVSSGVKITQDRPYVLDWSGDDDPPAPERIFFGAELDGAEVRAL